MCMNFLEDRPIPGRLKNITPDSMAAMDLPLKDILQHSLYYPAAGFDGRPVRYLGGKIHSFVYVDYGNSQAQLQRARLLPPG